MKESYIFGMKNADGSTAATARVNSSWHRPGVVVYEGDISLFGPVTLKESTPMRMEGIVGQAARRNGLQYFGDFGVYGSAS